MKSLLFACVFVVIASVAFSETCNDNNDLGCDGCDGTIRPGFICPFGTGEPCLRDGHELADPPTFDYELRNPNTLRLFFETASYGRTALNTEFVAQTGGYGVHLTWPDWAPIDECSSGVVGEWSLAQLIGNAGEVDLSDASNWKFKFVIRVTLTEAVYSYNTEPTPGEVVSRTITYDFPFVLIIGRSITVQSYVTGLSDSVLYALVTRSEVSSGSVTFEVETYTAEGVTINTNSVPSLSIAGSVTFDHTSEVAFVEYIGGDIRRQLWRFIIYLRNPDYYCQFDPADNIAMDVDLISSDPSAATGRPNPVTLVFRNLESENWCTVTDQNCLRGLQTTFSDVMRHNEASYYWMGDEVYVRIRLWYTANLITEPSDRADILDVITYSSSVGSRHLMAEPEAYYALDECDGYVCYHFTLAPHLFRSGETIRIRTRLTVAAPIRAESAITEANTTSSFFINVKAEGTPTNSASISSSWIWVVAAISALAKLLLQ